MIEVGQFLSKPSAAITFLSGLSIVGLALTWWTLQTARQKYLVRLTPAITDDVFIKAIGLSAAVSITLTLVLQSLSLHFLDTAVAVTGATVNEVGKFSSPKLNPAAQYTSVHTISNIAKSLSQNKNAAKATVVVAIVVAIALLLLVVGAGYAFAAVKLSFFSHFIAFTVGVGLVEEYTKAIAGIVIFCWIYHKASDDTPDIPIDFRRHFAAAFGLAGLGFGAGEALHYFGVYNDIGCGLELYAIRAVWCVTLHGCWTMISGAIYSSWALSVAESFSTLSDWARCEICGMTFVSCIPSMILHGFYDAACVHESGLCWITGIVSIITAYVVFRSLSGKEAPQEFPA